MTSELQKVEDSGSILPLLRQAATDPSVSVEKMERLFALQERWEKRESEKAFHASMIAARAEMPEVSKDSKGENSRYAKLEKIDRLIYPIYTKHAFSLQWSEAECSKPGWTRLKCVVLHRGGHREEHFLTGPMDDKGPKGAPNKTGIQGMGSTWSYLQRRLLAMIFNIRIVGEDNDGAAPRTQPPPSSIRDSAGKPIDPLKVEKAILWSALKQIDMRITLDEAAHFLIQQKIIPPGATLDKLTLAQLQTAIEKVEIILIERKT